MICINMSMHLLIDLSIIEMHLNVRLFFAGVANRRHVPPGTSANAQTPIDSTASHPTNKTSNRPEADSARFVDARM